MAVDMFLKIDGVAGESKDSKHANEIQIESFHWGASQPGAGHTGGGSGAGKVGVQDIVITKFYDKSSPTLLLHCCTGKHLPYALLTVRKAGAKPLEYLKMKFSDVLISGYDTGGDGEMLKENVSLNFANFLVEYQEQKPDGSGMPSAQAGYDLKKNEPF